MSNSKLIKYTKKSPNYSSRDGNKISVITIHHMAGILSVEQCGNIFANSARQASSNYGIGNDGRIALYVDEKYRAWTTSSYENDKKAVTIEVSNSKASGNYPISDKAMKSLISLCVDICKRNGIKKLNYTGDKKGNLTMHCWFAATACPGPYLKSKFKYIAEQVNKQLSTTTTTTVATPKVLATGKVVAKKGLTVRKKAALTGAVADILKYKTAVKCYKIVKNNGYTWWKISPTAERYCAAKTPTDTLIK